LLKIFFEKSIDLRRDIIEIYESLDDMEERLFQAQVVNLMVDRVKDCHSQFVMRPRTDNSLSTEEEGCLKMEFLLKEFLEKELAAERSIKVGLNSPNQNTPDNKQ